MSDYQDRHDRKEERRAERRNRWQERWDKRMEEHEKNPGSHIWTGIFLLIIGGLALAKSFGVPMPVWLFTWQMLLIGIGVFIGIKKGFRDGGWFVPIIIGGAFLVNDYVLLGDLRRHIWPLILIVLGVFFIFRPKRKNWASCQKKNSGAAGVTGATTNPLNEEYTQDDIIDTTCIFSGAKKVILSKNFKGGDLVNIFGGCEIDLTQADMQSPAMMDVTAIFGGATLIIPSNWAIKSEAVTIFGGINDKRKFSSVNDGTTKTIVLRGTIIFGGIEIKSY